MDFGTTFWPAVALHNLGLPARHRDDNLCFLRSEVKQVGGLAFIYRETLIYIHSEKHHLSILLSDTFKLLCSNAEVSFFIIAATSRTSLCVFLRPTDWTRPTPLCPSPPYEMRQLLVLLMVGRLPPSLG